MNASEFALVRHGICRGAALAYVLLIRSDRTDEARKAHREMARCEARLARMYWSQFIRAKKAGA